MVSYKGVNTGIHLGGTLFIELTANRTMWGASNLPFFCYWPLYPLCLNRKTVCLSHIILVNQQCICIQSECLHLK